VKNEPEDIKKEMEKVYDELSGTNTTDLKTWEVMIVLAYKD